MRLERYCFSSDHSDSCWSPVIQKTAQPPLFRCRKDRQECPVNRRFNRPKSRSSRRVDGGPDVRMWSPPPVQPQILQNVVDGRQTTMVLVNVEVAVTLDRVGLWKQAIQGENLQDGHAGCQCSVNPPDGDTQMNLSGSGLYSATVTCLRFR